MKEAFISSLNGGVGTHTVAMVGDLATSVVALDAYLFADYRRIWVPDLPRNARIITTNGSGPEGRVRW